MVARQAHVVDGGALACLGLVLRDGGRRADLRAPLAVALRLAQGGSGVVCYLDRNLPYRVREDQRDLLDLLLSEHPESFRTVPPRAAADYLLQRAGPSGAAIVAPGDLLADPGVRERYPWLAQPGRWLRPRLAEGAIELSPDERIEPTGDTAFDLYHRLASHLKRP